MKNIFDRFINFGQGKKPEHDQAKHWEKLDSTQDPVEDFRTNHEGSYDIHDENDIQERIVEEDETPEFMGKYTEDFSENHPADFSRSDESWDQLAEPMSIEEFLEDQDSQPEDIDNWTLADIIGDEPLKNKLKALEEESIRELEIKKTKETLEQTPIYTREEFALMEEAALYEKILKKTPEILSKRPVFADGSPMTDEQIVETIGKFWMVIRNKEFNKHNQGEIDFMRKCQNWFDIASKLEGYRKGPLMADGKPLTAQEIHELADEYYTFKNSTPEDFNTMKFEMHAQKMLEQGVWKQGSFKWFERKFKDKEDFSCIKESVVDGKKQVTRYVSEQDLKNLTPINKEASYYYTVRGEHVNKNDPTSKIVWVDLKFPRIPTKKPEKVI